MKKIDRKLQAVMLSLLLAAWVLPLLAPADSLLL